MARRSWKIDPAQISHQRLALLGGDIEACQLTHHRLYSKNIKTAVQVNDTRSLNGSVGSRKFPCLPFYIPNGVCADENSAIFIMMGHKEDSRRKLEQRRMWPLHCSKATLN